MPTELARTTAYETFDVELVSPAETFRVSFGAWGIVLALVGMTGRQGPALRFGQTEVTVDETEAISSGLHAIVAMLGKLGDNPVALALLGDAGDAVLQVARFARDAIDTGFTVQVMVGSDDSGDPFELVELDLLRNIQYGLN